MSTSATPDVDFHPRIEEAIEQLDPMIFNGDYWLDEQKRSAIGELLSTWSRGHAEHVVSFEAMRERGEM